MDLLNADTLLPGSITQIISEYTVGYDRSQFGTTDSVVVIGTAFDGPVGVPIEIYNSEHARTVFGRTYDSRTRKEATLTAGIADAYQKGCRTIYGLRVSGKNVEKEFETALNIPFKIKVASAAPSNTAKDFVLTYDDAVGNETIKIFKPASRATLREKSEGMVEHDEAVMVTTIRLNADLGITRDNAISDLIDAVNSHIDNNVIRLTMVDHDGNELASASKEVQGIPVKAMLPGIYMIGRDKTENMNAETKISYAVDADVEGFIVKTIDINTDVSAAFPIDAKETGELQTALRDADITMSSKYDFLEISGVADRAFIKDKMDYEEVDISKFDIYQRLGSGFAITAKIDNNKKRMEVPVSDPNRVIPMTDGIYSMLENLNARYRVLVCGTIEDKIENSLPPVSAFEKMLNKERDIFGGTMKVATKVEMKQGQEPKPYKFSLGTLAEGLVDSVKADLFDEVVIPIVSGADTLPTDKKYAPGTKILVGDDAESILYRYDGSKLVKADGVGLEGDLLIVGDTVFKGELTGTAPNQTTKFVAVTAPGTMFGEKEFILAESNGRVLVMKITTTTEPETLTVEGIGDVESIFSDSNIKTLVFATSTYGENNVVVKTEALDKMTLEEFTAALNEHNVLNDLFTFSMTQDGLLQKDSLVEDASEDLEIIDTLGADREVQVDTTLYLPYKTTDNFGRQLAQHCVYTSMKNSIPAHGIIGCETLSNLGLTSVADKVDKLVGDDYDLYAKRPNGRNMLDANNLPYPIGRALSLVFAQDRVVLDNGYGFISNGAAGYAGMVSVLALDQSSTNQPIANVNPMFELTSFQLGQLTQKGIITLRRSYNRGLVVTDGVTMAPAASPFRRLSVTRIVGAVEELIREASEPYIGRQNNPANRNSLQTAIKSQLEKIKGSLVEKYDFRMSMDPRIAKFAYIDIDYDIVPIYEIRQVRNRIRIKDEL